MATVWMMKPQICLGCHFGLSLWIATMKRRSMSKVLLAALSIPLVLLLVGIAWFVTYDPFKAIGNSLEPSMAMFLPQNAPLSLSLTVNPDRLLALSPSPLKFGPSKTQTELEGLRDSLLGLGELDYKTKVLPWLGDEMTLAVTSRDVDRTLQDGRQPGYLLILKTKDATASRDFLRSFWRLRSSMQSPQNTEIYKGSEITYGQVKNAIPQFSEVPFTLASAIVGNQYLLFANSPKVLKNAINNVQASSLNLQANAQYQRGLGAIDAQRLGVMYINLPEFTALTGDDSVVRSIAQLPEQSPVSYSAMAIALKASSSGLIFDTALVPETPLDLPTPKASTQSAKPLDVATVLPADSMTIAVGHNLSELWPTIARTIKGYPTLEQFQTQALQPLAAQSQLDLIQDVFQWVKGEYGLAIAPPHSNQPAEWVFAVKRETSEIQQGLAKLDGIARDRGLTLGPVKLSDSQTVQAWMQLSSANSPANLTAKPIAAHTTIGDYEVFSTSLETLGNLASHSKKTLETNANWNQSLHNTAMPNQGYFYTDWNAVQPIVEQKIPGLRLLEILAQPIVIHLKSLMVSASETSGSDIAKGTIVIGLK
jgi:hypothetical protein